MELYDIWKQLDLSWQELEHEPVFTIEQARAISDQLPGIGVKNLLLTDRKHTHYFLVLLHEDKRADVKSISQQTGVRHLTFGSAEELQQLLGLTPGSVSPFGIIHDRDNRVEVLIDHALIGQPLLLHPNTNTKTVCMHYDHLLRFIHFCAHSIQQIDCPGTSGQGSGGTP